jgi:ferredoxin
MALARPVLVTCYRLHRRRVISCYQCIRVCPRRMFDHVIPQLALTELMKFPTALSLFSPLICLPPLSWCESIQFNSDNALWFWTAQSDILPMNQFIALCIFRGSMEKVSCNSNWQLTCHSSILRTNAKCSIHLHMQSVSAVLDLWFFIFGMRHLAAGWSYIFILWWALNRVPLSIRQIASHLTAVCVSLECGTSAVLSCLSCCRPSAYSLPLKRPSV